jgi:hypothetical protein
MQSPWSRPTLVESEASKIGLWNVSRSPELSPAAPVSVTVSEIACSITWICTGDAMSGCAPTDAAASPRAAAAMKPAPIMRELRMAPLP